MVDVGCISIRTAKMCYRFNKSVSQYAFDSYRICLFIFSLAGRCYIDIKTSVASQWIERRERERESNSVNRNVNRKWVSSELTECVSNCVKYNWLVHCFNCNIISRSIIQLLLNCSFARSFVPPSTKYPGPTLTDRLAFRIVSCVLYVNDAKLQWIVS